MSTDDTELSIVVDYDVVGNSSYASLALNESISFSSDYAYIGGLPDLVKMLFTPPDNDKPVNGMERKSTLGNPFHGYLQDIRLNEMFLLPDPSDTTNFASSTWIDVLNRGNEEIDHKIVTPHSTSEMKTGESPEKDVCPCQNGGECIEGKHLLKFY